MTYQAWGSWIDPVLLLQAVPPAWGPDLLLMGLKKFLDLPLIALSNGQTRRARILKAIWTQPELLLLDEPLSV